MALPSITHYSTYDTLILDMAKSLELVMIGGTAMEVLATHYNEPTVRVRSKNDFDFIFGTDSLNTFENVFNSLKKHKPNIIYGGLMEPICTIQLGDDSNWAEVDLLQDYEREFQRSCLEIEGLKIISPKEQLRMKRERLHLAGSLSAEKIKIEEKDIELLKRWQKFGL